MKEKLQKAFYAIVVFIAGHKAITLISLVLAATIVAGTIVLPNLKTPSNTDVSSSEVSNVSSAESDPSDKVTTSSEVSSTQSQEATSSEVSSTQSQETDQSKETVSVDSQVESKEPSERKEETSSSTPTKKPEYNYNSNMTPDDNVFLDALEYTGYKLDVQRNSGRMWGSYGNYVLCSQKRGLGWLSDITYDDYGRATGYETDQNGKPDISYFENTGLVCASYVSYVYFNYLPNVAGIDTSVLDRPKKPTSANDWYIAGKKWVEKGYSRYIDFKASDGGSVNKDIKLTVDEEIPIGSLIILCDWYNRSDWCSHVCIYAGKMNGYHWVTHVGNENGPEFCAIERMNRKPHPQWPIAIITPPSNVDFSVNG